MMSENSAGIMQKSMKERISENFDIIQWIGTLTVFVSCFLFLLHRIELLEAKQDVRIQEQAARTDKLYETFQTELMAQSERSDKLYEMFIDLVKENKK